MSDFDDVLERLLTDPAFQTALRANPDAALAGYRLQPEERQLLAPSWTAAPAKSARSRLRISKSGVMGMRRSGRVRDRDWPAARRHRPAPACSG